MKIYTRTGDDGTTSLSGGQRVPKYHKRVQAYGDVDEIIAWIGLLRGHPQNEAREEILLFIQDQLMRCAAILSTRDMDGKMTKLLQGDSCLEKLEREIDRMEEELVPLKNFIVPGGNELVSFCHIARCVCRRAERSVLILNKAEKIPHIVIKFLNRLSDYLFVLARYVSKEQDNQEISWHI
jgi:cob(I)alamin adenosyltransferase